MNGFLITLLECGKKTIAGQYAYLTDAKQFLKEILYYSEADEEFKHLNVSGDGMSGHGNDGLTSFSYQIEPLTV